MTNADAHPQVFQRVIESDVNAGVYAFQTGVSAGLGGNSNLSVVLEVMSISHSVRMRQINVVDLVWDITSFDAKVGTSPKAEPMIDRDHDLLYSQFGHRTWGRVAGGGEITAYHDENLSRHVDYSAHGFGILIAAPQLLFTLFQKNLGDASTRPMTCSFTMTYRYRTLPFHQWKKIHNEQTTKNAVFVN